MEMVKRNALSTHKMRAAFAESVGAALGAQSHVWDEGAELGRGPLLAETELYPWDIQVKAQAVQLAGKLRQSPAPSANRSLKGELGKALAYAKRNGNNTTRKNTLQEHSQSQHHAQEHPARTLSVAWSLPQVHPRRGAGKRRWKEHIRKRMPEDPAQATRASLKVRPESLEEGGI